MVGWKFSDRGHYFSHLVVEEGRMRILNFKFGKYFILSEKLEDICYVYLELCVFYFFYFLCKKNFFLSLFIFERERGRQSVSRGGAERERGRHRIQSRLQPRSCQHRARLGARTHEPWDHDLSWSWTLNRLSHPGAPTYYHFRIYLHSSLLIILKEPADLS